MLPYLVYGLAASLAGLVMVTFVAMIMTDLVDGRVARRLKQARAFGGVLDSTVDFVVIYALFTALFLICVLSWWKWLVIFAPAVLMAVTQVLHMLRASEVEFAPAPVGKLVGMIQYVYLPFLFARRFWLQDAPWPTIDHLAFAVLAVAIVFNTLAYGGTLRDLLRRPGTATVP